MLTIYSAEWCSPCSSLKNLLNKNNIEYTVIDIDKDPNRARSQGIRGIPTLVNTDTGDRLVGAVTLEQIQKLIN